MFEFSFFHLLFFFFFFFFRFQEVLYFKYGDITFHDTYVAIKVDRSKTRYVSELERFPVEPSHYVPLTKSKLGHKFVSINKPISYSAVRE